MSSNISEFSRLLDELTMASLSKSIVKSIDKFFYKMALPSIDMAAVSDKVGSLSDSAKDALIQGMKEEDVAKVLSILGLHSRKEEVI